MKYIVLLKSSVIIDAETPEEVTDQVDDAVEDARIRNCGNIDDEIMASIAVTEIKTEESDDK